MAGADEGQRRLWDLSRRAASFLRMARLALTGAAPARLLAEGEVVDGHSCDPYYKSISTEDDDLESGELWLEEDESELLVEDEDGSVARGLSEKNSTLVCCGVVCGGSLNKKSQFIRRQPETAGAALRSETVAAAVESSEPLMPHRTAKRVNVAEVVHHPFGCDRRGSEASTLLLVSS
ncbi:hypothetical protein BAE44_0016422 [Dichanthelium oligosanthes]|uniref:Uncharacterized protein n=1 Tax=Dichanthelium oligosanthes TaxID=888268 RepID=A0A1E5VBL8_9POAL|nr:hypothetical protein BAE44_0016422 [Dichanthelium oligosanthes]